MSIFRDNSIGRQKRFSLTELLVVMAILAVMLSLLQPSLLRVLEHTKEVHCGTKLKRMLMGLELLTSNEGDYYPFGIKNWQADYLGRLANFMDMKSEEQDQNFMRCPSDLDSPGLISYGFLSGPWGTKLHYSLTGNLKLFAQYSGVSNPKRYHSSIVQIPDKTYVFSDGHGRGCHEWGQIFTIGHRTGINMIFADGHVECVEGNKPFGYKFNGATDRPFTTNVDKYPWLPK